MRYDVVLVTYNSEKWLPGCVAALAGARYPLGELRLIFCDNASTDGTRQTLARLRGEYPAFGGFELVENEKNLGFGTACNRGAARGDAPTVFFLNVDTEIDPEVFTQLDAAQTRWPDAGGYECRQTPYETGHHIDPVTMETTWASGAALAVPRAVLEETGGFDEHLFLYCEDVDLSWRIRARGYRLYYVPFARVTHYSYENGGPKLGEYAGSFYGNLLLRYKFGGPRTIWEGHKMYLGELRRPLHFDGVRRVLAKNYLRHFLSLWPFLFWRFSHRREYAARTCQFEGGFSADRGLHALTPVENGPLVSVVIRTCGRPQSLRKTLQSLRWQTYRNFEVVITEDGPDTARAMLEAEFSDLPIRYHATGDPVGRGRAGNIGLSLARGEWLNFLDDDDYFYPDHLEQMSAYALAHPQAEMVLGCSLMLRMEMVDPARWEYRTVELHPVRFGRIDLFTLSQMCQIPIQSVMFHRSLYERYGGLCEDIGSDEDWFMWMNFIAHGRRNDPPLLDIPRATSVFLVPCEGPEARRREEKYKAYDKTFFADERMRFTVSLADLRRYYDNMIADLRCLEARGTLHEFLEREAKRGE